MRLLRRNALGLYAVYAASIVSGLVVTPVAIHALGATAWGLWGAIGGWTIYLSVLDFGVAPSIIRYGAQARGRGSTEDLNAVASVGLALYALIAAITIPVGIGLAFLIPFAAHAPHHLIWPARFATLIVVAAFAARFPLGMFVNLLIAHQRWDIQNLSNFVSTALYALIVVALVRHFGSLVLLATAMLITTVLRLAMPLLWLRSELPGLRLARSYVTRVRIRELVAFSWSNFLVHVAQKIVFSTDVIVVSIVLGATSAGVYSIPAKLFALAFGLGTAVTTLLFPAFAELEGANDPERQRRLLLIGLRGGMGLMLLIALPLLLIPDLLIHGWIGAGYSSAYSVMALLAGVLLVHQPIFVLTQFLIARGRQRQAALVSIVFTLANLVLSVILAWAVGIWGVAFSTLVTDLAALWWLIPWIAAPAAGITAGRLLRASIRPFLPAAVAAGLVLVGVARLWSPTTLVELTPLGLLWCAVGAAAIWWGGFSSDQRASVVAGFRGRSTRPAGEAGLDPLL